MLGNAGRCIAIAKCSRGKMRNERSLLSAKRSESLLKRFVVIIAGKLSLRSAI